MLIGSMYSGIGGLDLACEWALGARTAWQLDRVGAEVRRRHWPEALQVQADVADVDPLLLPRVDVLCAGFACQDLSTAGKGASKKDLTKGKRTGTTYLHALRFVTALQPEIVVLENVPEVLHHRARIEADLVGYGCTWTLIEAADVGAPHLRRRVFMVARRDTQHQGLVAVPAPGRWSALESERTWATPKGSDARSPGPSVSTARQGSDGLACEARLWPTATARDYRTDFGIERIRDRGAKGESLSQAAACGSRLNPAWVEALMGFPSGWTAPQGEQLHAHLAHRWPRGRYPVDWDRTQLWPGFAWEPPRTLPDGPPCRGRPARIRALGNAVVPQQGEAAIRAALQPAQVGLFAEAS